uniref:NADPH oxidase organizer 1 n=1 Tax=Cairina moschata TaxID=8855 RepID=A0A8C3D478_CAIMO
GKMSRFPVDVKAVGLMQCRKQKYMMFVSWSDQNNILIYRTFEEFKRLHKELKRKFPIESGSLRRSDRTIPNYLQPGPLQGRVQRKMNKFLERLKLLETYSQELLKTDAKISQSEDLIQFFRAQTQDLDPCFPEDSVVIMPSEIGGEKKKQAQQQLSITNPQASQSYRCIETFETKDTKNQAFKVAQKEIVEVLLKDMTGWWLVENADKQIAWFPASYLEEIDVHEDIQDALSSLYFVMRAYESQKADELSLHSGVVVEVVRKSDNGWWLSWKPDLSRSLPEVEQVRSPRLGKALATHSSKSPHLTHKDRNDSGFVEPSAVPARPSAHEILQRCSTVTRRALRQSTPQLAPQALSRLPNVQ